MQHANERRVGSTIFKRVQAGVHALSYASVLLLRPKKLNGTRYRVAVLQGMLDCHAWVLLLGNAYSPDVQPPENPGLPLPLKGQE